MVLTLAVAMLFWNWKLLLAIGVGVLVMLLVYWMQDWDWQIPWLEIRRFLNGSNRQLTLAVGSGGIATLSTYMTAAIWIDSDSPWIAAGAIVQSFGTLLTLVLLVWQIVIANASRDEAQLEQLLTELTEVDPLKRLIAVRQMTRLVTRTRFESSDHRTAAEYLRLLLSREQETIVQEAVLNSLQALDKVQQLSSVAPLSTPSSLKRSVAKSSQNINREVKSQNLDSRS